MSNGTGTSLTTFDPKQLAVLDEVASQCDIALREAGNNISGALAVAENMQRLRQLITPQMLQSLAALQGTALGFRTDRKNAKSGAKEYSPEELRDPFIEATVRGFRAIGNEFNIIAGNFYGAKAGFERKVRTFPGLGDFQALYDIEETAGGFARVQCVATWVLGGKTDQFCRRRESIDGKPFDNRIRVKVNEGMGYDALIGKAQRKFYAAVYDYLINVDTATPEGDPDDTLVDPEAGQKVRRSQVFDDVPAEQSASPDESDQAPRVLAYRAKLAAIAARPEVSGIAREAGKDASLTPASRAQIMSLCSEAMKVWPKRLDAGQVSSSPDPEPESRSASGASGTSHEPGAESDTLSEYLDQMDQKETISDATRWRDQANADKNLSDASKAKIQARFEMRVANVRASRGQRANGESP